jgi:DNA-binding PadR family transcriptional regulator
MRATEASPLSVPVYQILLSLSDRALHGYAILKDIRERTGNKVVLAAGTLYAAIGRLEEQGWIEEAPDPPADEAEDPRRRYFRITDAGLAAARHEAERLRWFARMAEDKELLGKAAREGGE